MAKITISEDTCKGCALCTTQCPKKILRLSDRINKHGYRPSECFDESKCIGCAFCAIICPDCAIIVER